MRRSRRLDPDDDEDEDEEFCHHSWRVTVWTVGSKVIQAQLHMNLF